MAKETEVIEETVEKEVTHYVCDKCHGHNHEETQLEEDLNKVIFGAEAHYLATMFNGDTSDMSPTVSGKYEYLLCDECMERAHDYLSDFF